MLNQSVPAISFRKHLSNRGPSGLKSCNAGTPCTLKTNYLLPVFSRLSFVVLKGFFLFFELLLGSLSFNPLSCPFLPLLISLVACWDLLAASLGLVLTRESKEADDRDETDFLSSPLYYKKKTNFLYVEHQIRGNNKSLYDRWCHWVCKRG